MQIPWRVKGHESLQTQALKNKVKYIKINQAPLEKLLAHLQEKNITTLTGKEAFALLDHILEEVNFTPEDFESYIVVFNKIHPVEIESFYGTQAKARTRVKI
jgi:superfamily II DNA/RNA helicase